MATKAEITELAGRVREAAQRQDPIALAVIKLLAATLDSTKETLVNVAGDDMLRAQGAARELQRLHRELTETPAPIKAGAPR